MGKFGPSRQKKETENLQAQTAAMKAPEVPLAKNVTEAAKKSQVDQRRTILATGGDVDKTMGMAGLTDKQVKKKTLG